MDFEIQRSLLNAVLRVISVQRAYETRKEYPLTPLSIPMICHSMAQRSSATLICGLRALANAEGEGSQVASTFNDLIEDSQEHLFEPLTGEEETGYFDGILNHLVAQGSGYGGFDPYSLALTNGRTMEDYLSDYLLAANRKFFNLEEAFLCLANFYQAGYESSHYTDFKAYQASVIALHEVIPDEKFSEQIKSRITQYIDIIDSDTD